MIRKILLGSGVAVALAVLAMGQPYAQQRRTVVVTPQPAVQARQVLNLPLNKSEVLRVSEPVKRIAVGNADIADAQPLSDQQFYILGKAVGTTNISVYGDSDRLLAVIDVVVGIDVEGVKAAIHSLLPGERIEVRAINDSVALSGTVNSALKIAQAVEIAKHFTDTSKQGAAESKVINDLRVSGTQQVMLQVKVAEMQRTATKQLGFLPAFNIRNPGSPSSIPFTPSTTGDTSVPTANAGGFSSATQSTSSITALSNFAVASATAVSGNFAFNATLQALEQNGAVKILAEPNLIALSGDTANFLAGGEFPVPTNETGVGTVPTITVSFKTFGVSLAFTPTVIGDDLINLVVAPEVSELDPQNGVVVNGFNIPGISTRRAKTTVEVRDGQSFAIAGLLQSDFADQVQQIPGFGDIPVLGALARDSQFQNNETELVIIITPRLVHPAPAGTLKSPTDSFILPSDADMFLNGKTEGSLPATDGGLSGQYGHIIR
jgi:pilus assembly protein CpaC